MRVSSASATRWTTEPRLGDVPRAVGSTQDATLRGEDDFLKLLIAQLRKQDPRDALANDQFITPSAQFSPVAAGTALGRPVVAMSASFTYAGATVSLPLTLGAGLDGGLLEISDANGRILTRLPLGLRDAGAQTFEFHPGQTDPALRSGAYRYRIVAPDAQGQLAALPAITGVVTGVSLDNGVPVLWLGARRVDLSAVTSVGATTN